MPAETIRRPCRVGCRSASNLIHAGAHVSRCPLAFVVPQSSPVLSCAGFRCLSMLKSSLLVLMIYACLRASSASRSSHQATAMWFKRLDKSVSRYDEDKQDYINIIDKCGDEREKKCIRKALEKKWPDKRWDVTYAEDQESYERQFRSFMHHWTRLLFHFNLDAHHLFIMADPK